jgi:hypothetical protein
MAIIVTAGGNCLSDTALPRHQTGLAGPVASPATMWRRINQLTRTPRMLDAVLAARSAVRSLVSGLRLAAVCEQIAGDARRAQSRHRAQRGTSGDTAPVGVAGVHTRGVA